MARQQDLGCCPGESPDVKDEVQTATLRAERQWFLGGGFFIYLFFSDNRSNLDDSRFRCKGACPGQGSQLFTRIKPVNGSGLVLTHRRWCRGDVIVSIVAILLN